MSIVHVYLPPRGGSPVYASIVVHCPRRHFPSGAVLSMQVVYVHHSSVTERSHFP